MPTGRHTLLRTVSPTYSIVDFGVGSSPSRQLATAVPSVSETAAEMAVRTNQFNFHQIRAQNVDLTVEFKDHGGGFDVFAPRDLLERSTAPIRVRMDYILEEIERRRVEAGRVNRTAAFAELERQIKKKFYSDTLSVGRSWGRPLIRDKVYEVNYQPRTLVSFPYGTPVTLPGLTNIFTDRGGLLLVWASLTMTVIHSHSFDLTMTVEDLSTGDVLSRETVQWKESGMAVESETTGEFTADLVCHGSTSMIRPGGRYNVTVEATAGGAGATGIAGHLIAIQGDPAEDITDLIKKRYRWHRLVCADSNKNIIGLTLEIMETYGGRKLGKVRANRLAFDAFPMMLQCFDSSWSEYDPALVYTSPQNPEIGELWLEEDLIAKIWPDTEEIPVSPNFTVRSGEECGANGDYDFVASFTLDYYDGGNKFFGYIVNFGHGVGRAADAVRIGPFTKNIDQVPLLVTPSHCGRYLVTIEDQVYINDLSDSYFTPTFGWFFRFRRRLRESVGSLAPGPPQEDRELLKFDGFMYRYRQTLGEPNPMPLVIWTEPQRWPDTDPPTPAPEDRFALWAREGTGISTVGGYMHRQEYRGELLWTDPVPTEDPELEYRALAPRMTRKDGVRPSYYSTKGWPDTTLRGTAYAELGRVAPKADHPYGDTLRVMTTISAFGAPVVVMRTLVSGSYRYYRAVKTTAASPNDYLEMETPGEWFLGKETIAPADLPHRPIFVPHNGSVVEPTTGCEYTHIHAATSWSLVYTVNTTSGTECRVLQEDGTVLRPS